MLHATTTRVKSQFFSVLSCCQAGFLLKNADLKKKRESENRNTLFFLKNHRFKSVI
jgi:hypothetical protein